MGQGKKSSAKAIGIQQRRRQVLELRRNGASIRAIAETLGYSHQLIHKDLKVALQAAIQQNTQSAEQNRQLELERLDALYLRVSKEVFNHVKTLDIQAVNTLLKISEQRAKLLGLNAPEAQSIRVEHKNVEQLSDDELQRIASAGSGIRVVTPPRRKTQSS